MKLKMKMMMMMTKNITSMETMTGSIMNATKLYTKML